VVYIFLYRRHILNYFGFWHNVPIQLWRRLKNSDNWVCWNKHITCIVPVTNFALIQNGVTALLRYTLYSCAFISTLDRPRNMKSMFGNLLLLKWNIIVTVLILADITLVRQLFAKNSSAEIHAIAASRLVTTTAYRCCIHIYRHARFRHILTIIYHNYEETFL
jgi:hypothetical protein